MNRKIALLLAALLVLVVMMFAMSPGFAIGQGDVKKVTPEPPTPKAGELPPEAKAGDVVQQPAGEAGNHITALNSMQAGHNPGPACMPQCL